ncbi:calmodulin-like [Mya arenaria]|uniref:calmodulin-like n=1 Tax=Mya arenaria TaxID=6604 RepID=UPI0022E61593|nr:calmodulin-like [Mya arenaria]
MTSPEEIFNEICPDNAATKVQAYQALTNCGKNPISQSVGLFWEEKELGDDDTIDYDQFTELLGQIPDPTLEEYIEAFKQFDVNEDCTISAEELKKIIKMQDDLLGSDDHNDEEFIESLIQQGDTGEGGNQDGKLDYAELAKLFMDGIIG